MIRMRVSMTMSPSDVGNDEDGDDDGGDGGGDEDEDDVNDDDDDDKVDDDDDDARPLIVCCTDTRFRVCRFGVLVPLHQQDSGFSFVAGCQTICTSMRRNSRLSLLF